MLFSGRSLVTMAHGLVFGGGALVALAAALFYLYAQRTAEGTRLISLHESRAFTWLTVAAAALIWFAVIGGTYLVFPPYRATPPPGTADLADYPRALLMENPDTAWLHAFGMESKEHMPWIAGMLATAVAFLGMRYRSAVLTDAPMRRLATVFLAISLALVAFVSLLGVFVNKIAPLE